MKENNTLQALLQRASEQSIIEDIPFAHFFLFMSRTFGENPWRIIIPFSFLSVLFLHLYFGKMFDNAILWLFGGL